MKTILLTSALFIATSLAIASPLEKNYRKPIYIDNYGDTDIQYSYQVLGSYKWEGPYTIPAKTDVKPIQPATPLYETPIYWEFWVPNTDCKNGKLMTITGPYAENFNLVDITSNGSGITINPIDKDGGGPYGQLINCSSKKTH